jgi:hypothetical protein
LAVVVVALGTATALAAPASADDQFQKFAVFGGLAVYAYCRDKLPAGAGS